jgi:hypothetical protein
VPAVHALSSQFDDRLWGEARYLLKASQYQGRLFGEPLKLGAWADEGRGGRLPPGGRRYDIWRREPAHYEGSKQLKLF